MTYTARQLGLTEFFEAQRAAIDVPPTSIGRVTTAIGSHVRVEVPEAGPADLMLGPHGTYPEHVGRPVVGDWVVVDHENGLVSSVLDRATLVKRQRPGKRISTQPVVANVDIVAIVTSANRDFNTRRLERYLTVVHDSGARPIVVINKCDLSDEPRSYRDQATAVAPGVDVLMASALEGAVDTIRDELQEGVAIAFVGSSGVGKSTIINALIGEERLETAEIRLDDDKGRHTTTRRELIVLEDGGGLLIDTPGMREIQLAADEEALDLAFEDIQQLAMECKFRDCAHTGEPGCAVTDAVESGELDPARLDNYHRMAAEIAYREKKRDEGASSAEKKRRKEVSREIRRTRKRRKKT